MKAAGALFCLLGLFGTAPGCGLVDESYATTGLKSINGTDAFQRLLERHGDVHTVSHVSERVLSKADLLVHFEATSLPVSYYSQVETWLMGKPLFDGQDEPKVGTDNEGKKSSKSEGGDPETGNGRKGEGAAKPKRLRVPVFEVPKRARTLLYVARDTDASVAFWKRLTRQMEGQGVVEQWCRAILEQRAEAANVFPAAGAVLFGKREGDRVRSWLPAGSLAVPGLQWSFRLKPGPARYRDGRLVPARTVLSAGSVVGVRSLRTPAARIVAVYNGEPLLNYSLVRAPARQFARALLDGVFEDLAVDQPQIYIIRDSLLPAAKAAREDNLLRVFRVFPLNFILLHLAVLFALFVFSRWPHERTPLEVARVGTRTFLEHIDALGARLARSRQRTQAVRGIRRYLELHQKRAAGDRDRLGDESEKALSSQQLLREARTYWEKKKP